jgi:Tfp pilus assembly protein PilX
MSAVRMRSQGGAALIAVIFLIVVVAGLGAFAIRTGLEQQHMSGLSLLELRADAAAYTGLELASNRLNGGAIVCPPPIVFPASAPGMNGFTVTIACTPVVGTSLYDIRATAFYGNFGSPDRVQRIRTRRVSSIGGGSW